MSRKPLHGESVCLCAGDAAASRPAVSGDWWRSLEIIGAELFQRYRKRLMTPGIALEIRRDYPGLSLPDILLRVHAGRRILQDGDDFRALAAIRSGRWQCHLAACAQSRSDPRTAGDCLSRWLIRLGGLLFVVFCTLPLIAALPGGAADGAVLLSVFASVLAVWTGWWLVPRGVRDGWISHLVRRRLDSGAVVPLRATGQRDAAPSVWSAEA